MKRIARGVFVFGAALGCANRAAPSAWDGAVAWTGADLGGVRSRLPASTGTPAGIADAGGPTRADALADFDTGATASGGDAGGRDGALVSSRDTSQDLGHPSDGSTSAWANVGAELVPLALGSGAHYLEGPLWIAAQQALLFSDIQGNVTWRLRAGEPLEKYRTATNWGNGLALGPRHELFVCEMGQGAPAGLMRLALPTDLTRPPAAAVAVRQWMGMELNEPNDVIVRGDGNVYFTDPGYNSGPGAVERIFRMDPDGKLSAVTDKLRRPNGIALSPGGRRIYVGAGVQIHQAAVAQDGAVGEFAPLLKVQNDYEADGLTVDDAGNIYLAGSARGIDVFDGEGRRFGTIRITASKTTNVAFGGPQGKTLFVTTPSALYKAELPVAGPP